MILLIFLTILYGFRKAHAFPGFYMNPGKDSSSYLKKLYYTEQLILPIILGYLPIMLLMNELSAFFQFFCLLAYPPFIMGTFPMKRNIPLRFKEYPDIFSKIHWGYPVFFLAVWIYLFLEVNNII